MIDGRTYTVGFNSLTVTTADNLIQLATGATVIAEILEARLGQENLEGDAAAQMLEVAWLRQTGVATGANPVARPHNQNEGTATVTIKDTITGDGAGPTTFFEDSWNMQAGWLYVPTPESRIWMGISEFLALHLPNSPTGSPVMYGSITFREYDV